MVSVKLARFGAFVLASGLFCFSTHATAQYNQTLYVDCSLSAPSGSTYSSINAALYAASDRTAIYVQAGTVCNESIYLSDFTDVSIYSSMGFTLNGNLTIQNSRSVYILGVNVTNPNGDGIDVNSSDGVTIEDSSSSNNSGVGLSISASNVTVNHVDSFDYNLGGGVLAALNSTLNFSRLVAHRGAFRIDWQLRFRASHGSFNRGVLRQHHDQQYGFLSWRNLP